MRYVFGDYTLDTALYALQHAGTPIKLRPKVFHLLAYLVTHRDRVISKQELCAALWPQQVISEATLNACLAAARHAVGDSGQTQRVIHTLHGYGYRFVAAVEGPGPADAAAAAAPALPIAPPAGPGESPPPALQPLTGEHKVVTVLMCTLTQPPQGASRREAEAWHHVWQAFLAHVREEVARYEGTLQEVQEEGVLVLFGAPVAQEDHAQRAVLAALGLCQRLREVGTVRLGLHTGPLVINRSSPAQPLEYTAVGETIALATRVQSLAPPGGVAVSEVTHTHVVGLFETRVLRVPADPESPVPLRVFAILRARGRRTRFEVAAERGLTPYVGREQELAVLRDRFQQVHAGHGQVVCLVGEAGIGKSRHLFEFRHAVAPAGDGITWLEGRCVAFGQTVPFLPVIAHLRAAFGIAEADGPAAIITKVDDSLRTLGALNGHAPALRYLLAVEPGDPALETLEPAARRQRLFEAILAVVMGCAQRHPLVLVYEDIHWSDTSTATLLRTLLDEVAGLPLMVLLTYRVGYTPPLESRSFLTTITLQRLSAADTLAMARSLLGPVALSAALQHVLLEQTAGVPLFVEEVVPTLRTPRGMLWTPSNTSLPGGAEGDIPDAIQGIITARLDRLSAAGKRTVHLASVLGRQFPLSLLVPLADVPALDKVLGELQAREILERRGLLPEPTYAFKHAVVQEVAYHSLLLQQRQALHQAIGTAMETRSPERLAEYYAELAYHFFHGAQWSKAMHYSMLAGDRAADAYATTEAQAQYARALEAATHLDPAPDPGVVARLHAKHGAALMVLAAYEKAVDAYQQALALLRQVGDRRSEMEVLLGLSTVYTNTHSFGAAPALAVIEEALAIARALQDRPWQAVCLASRVRLRTRGYGQLREATPDAEDALRLARETQQPRLLAETLIALGRVLQWRGEVNQSLGYLREGADLAHQANAGFLFGMAAFFLGTARTAQGAYDDAWQWYEQLHAYATRSADQYWIARVPNAFGGLALELGDLDTALLYTRAGTTLDQHASSWSEVQGHALVTAGLAHLYQGEHSQAEMCFHRATALLEIDLWMRWRWHIVLLRGQGELALAQGRQDEAWSYATASLALATQTDSRKHIARAHWLQGEVLAACGRFHEAAGTMRVSIQVAEQLHLPHDIWRGYAALGRVLTCLGCDREAEGAYRQATQTLETLAAHLETPQMRRTLLSAAPVLALYTVLGQCPPAVTPSSD